MKITIKSLNALLKQQGRSEEVTRYKGEFWLLHICKNGVPVPFNHDKDIMGIKSAIELLGSVK